MSLRAFHIIFIIASVLLCLYVGLWAMRSNPILGAISFLVGAALVIYGKKAFRKLRELP